MMEWARERYPKEPSDSDFVYKQTIKAKACDTVRGMLPAATISNVGIYGTGQALRGAAAADARPPAARGADLRAADARRAAQGDPVVPRARRPPRPRRRVDRRTSPRPATTPPTSSPRIFGADEPEPAADVTLLDWDPDGEDKVLAAICYPHTDLPEAQLLDRVRRLPADDRIALVHAYVGERTNRRHKPGRAFERTGVPLRRARRLRRVPRPATAPHADDRVAAAVTRATATTCPAPVVDAGLAARFDDAMERSAALYDALVERVPRAGRVRGVARVPHALRDADERARGDAPVRVAQLAARSSELSPHRAVDAPADRGASRPPRDRGGDAYVDHGESDLERLDAERAAEARRVVRS